MTSSRPGHPVLSAIAITATATALLTIPAGAVTVTRTSGTGESVSVSWTEYDPDDLLGLPGNVHIGYIYADTGPYGTYISGSVADFDCEEGETPWGGGHEVIEHIVLETTDTAADAVEESIEEIIKTGQSMIDAEAVVDAVQAELLDEFSDAVDDHFEEIPACDYIQDRFLDGTGTATVSIDAKRKIAQITGTLTVSNGGHGEPGQVLGAPPIELTITGGDWEKSEYSSLYKTQSYSYSNWQKGTGYSGGEVTGRIGAMDFADDVDDEAYGYFNQYRFRTVDRVR